MRAAAPPLVAIVVRDRRWLSRHPAPPTSRFVPSAVYRRHCEISQQIEDAKAMIAEETDAEMVELAQVRCSSHSYY